MKAKVKKFIRFVCSRNTFLLLSLLAQIALMIIMFFITDRYVTKILGSAITVFAFIVALFIHNSRSHPDTKLAYVIILVLFPLLGILIYIFTVLSMGNHKFKKHLKKVQKETTPLVQNVDAIANLDDNIKGISYYLYNSCNFPTYKNTTCKYYPDGQSKLEDMVEALKSAEKFIFLEYYIIQHGKFLSTIMDILEEKVKHGVEVRFMYDGTSSIAKIPHSFVKKTNKKGIKCKMFLPVRAIISTEYNNRDHRKLCIIDNKIAFTGGINLADEYIGLKEPFGKWKDVGIKIEGEAVTSFTQMFLKMWNFKQKQIEDFSVYTNSCHKTENNGVFIPFGDHPHDNEDVSKTVILQTLATAKKYVHFTTPYLILDDELTHALVNTAKRGVDVSIATPGRPDKKITYYVTISNYRKLIEGGVKIYQYTPGFIHAKMMICDDSCAMLGTVNLDYRSLYLNFEDSVFIYDNSEVLEIEHDFNKIINDSKLVDITEYKKINILKRFIGGLFKIIAPLL